MATRPFDLDNQRLPIAIGYRNKDYIADMVLPYVPVPSELFSWNEWNIAEMYQPQQTEVGRTTAVEEVQLSATSRPGSIVDHGLQMAVPQTDINRAPAGYDPLDHATMGVAELVLLARERRAAALVFNAANYDNTITLSGSDRFSDPLSDGLSIMLDALDAPLVRPNKIVFGQSVWRKFRQLPAIVQATKGAGQTKGAALLEDIAELLEVDEILVGKSRLNTANIGQTAVFGRTWGNFVALLHTHPLAQAEGPFVTWGFTARFGTRIVQTRTDENIGLLGGTWVKVGEQARELVASKAAGYLIQNAIA